MAPSGRGEGRVSVALRRRRHHLLNGVTVGTRIDRDVPPGVRTGALEGRTCAHDVRRLMPKIRWADLPPSLRQHLFDRVADRQIPAEDLYKLKLWRESEPEALAGPW